MTLRGIESQLSRTGVAIAALTVAVAATISLDLMVSIEEKIGHRIKLESVASATLGTGKTAQGLDAIRWWREGKYREVAEYCCYDVKVTKLVHEFGAKNGYIQYDDKFGHIQKAEVDWDLAQ